MQNNIPTTLTPEVISETSFVFKIPVYQRLFVWNEHQISRLLNDLYEASKCDTPYYIGLITVFQDSDSKNIIEVVDGQQRLTFLMLIGAALQDKWRKFLKTGDKTRLDYFGRKKDMDSLESIIGCFNTTKENIIGCFDTTKSTNTNMNDFARCFEIFKQNKDMQHFPEFVFEKCTLLVSKLPENYEANHLNIYFEKLNSTGKQLEAHEILKVKFFTKVSAIWNKVANDSKRYTDKTDEDKANEAKVDTSILKILETNNDVAKEPDSHNISNANRGVITFPAFLLHVNKHLGRNKNDGLDTQKLLEIFGETYNDTVEADKFINEMVRYREWLDENIIHFEDSVPRLTWGKEAKSDESKEMTQLQHMLDVSSSDNQMWIFEAYQKTGGGKLTFEKLKDIDNELHPLDLENLNQGYGAINRYWFWKLDYILWLERDKVFEKHTEIFKEYKTAIDSFTFSESRSIEHLHAQNRETDSNKRGFNDTNRHCFGNLAMISSSSNSKLSNKTVTEKFAKIIDKKLESLKLLLMFCIADKKDVNWTPEEAHTHEKEMIEIFEKYYDEKTDSKEA